MVGLLEVLAILNDSVWPCDSAWFRDPMTEPAALPCAIRWLIPIDFALNNNRKGKRDAGPREVPGWPWAACLVEGEEEGIWGIWEQSWLCHGDSTQEEEFSYLGLGHSLQ